MDFKEVIEIVNTECGMQVRCSECYLQNACEMCDAVLPQVLRELQGIMEIMNNNEYKAPPKCPQCGSTAQVTHNGYVDLCGDGKMYKRYVCGCGCVFVRTGI